MKLEDMDYASVEERLLAAYGASTIDDHYARVHDVILREGTSKEAKANQFVHMYGLVTPPAIDQESEK